MPVIYPDSEALGILVCERESGPPFAENRFLRLLILAGLRMGCTVFAFAPWTWDPNDDTVRAWTWDAKERQWLSARRRLPALVYDRSWPDDDSERFRFRLALRRLQDTRRLVFLSTPLPDKSRVHEVLHKDPVLAPLLPETEIYAGPASLESWLDRHGGSAFLKPAGGSQGRSTAACRRLPDGTVSVSGRTGRNVPFDAVFRSVPHASEKLHRWMGGRPYLMQPLLNLRTSGGEPFDMRALVQKTAGGRWRLTGIAARCGLAGSITANLHGGGLAHPAAAYIESLFGPARSESLIRDIGSACRAVVRLLERYYGRLAELGLDFGIDRSGRLWFLEANSKPGRAAMNCLGARAAEAAAARPIAYARSIMLRPPGRVLHEFDHL